MSKPVACATYGPWLTFGLFVLLRNYDILAAVFTDVLKFMHDDLNII